MEETHQGPGDMWQGENWALGDSRVEVACDLGQERRVFLGQERRVFQGRERVGHEGALRPAGTHGRRVWLEPGSRCGCQKTRLEWGH